MDRKEARRIAERIGEEVENRAPTAIRALLGANDEFQVTGSDGKEYRVMVQAWQKLGNANQLEIVVSVSDGSLRSEIFPAGWNKWITLDS